MMPRFKFVSAKRILVGAFVLSAFIHVFFFFGDRLLTLNFDFTDDVLSSKTPGEIQKIRLGEKKPQQKNTAQKPMGIRYIGYTANTPPTPKANKPKPKQVVSQTQTEKPKAVLEPESTPDNTTSTIADLQTKIPEPIKVEPPPNFPVQITAEFDAKYGMFSTTLYQDWLMEGGSFYISNRLRKFGVTATITSDGAIHPTLGLQPFHSEVTVNNKIDSKSTYSNGQLTYGEPLNSSTINTDTIPQDLASLPFQIAFSYAGTPLQISVTSGKKLYLVQIKALAEEELQLPAGKIRTLHLAGYRWDNNSQSQQKNYEIWLALDYFNYPVKFVGTVGKWELSYRVSALEIEGQVILGKKNTTNEDTSEPIPDWVKERMHKQDYVPVQ